MKKFILPLIFMFIVGIFIFAKILNGNLKKETEDEKNLLESIQLVDMNGNDYTFSRDKNIYIKFWASWCPTCLAGLEELDRLAGENNKSKLFFIIFYYNKIVSFFIKLFWYTLQSKSYIIII